MGIPALNSQVAVNDNNTCQVNSIQNDDPKKSLYGIKAQDPAAKVLLFGYTHRKSMSQRSAALAFAHDILPQLKADGYRDLVLEAVHHGQRGSKIEKELTVFNRTGKIGPEIKNILPFLDKASYIYLLNTAHRLGIKVHSGGWNFESGLNIGFIQKVSEINVNSSKAISDLVVNGRRVASFGGAAHNNFTDVPNQQDISFAKPLAKKFPGKIVEIDLVIPELSNEDNLFLQIPISRACDWKSFIPQSGIDLITPIPFVHTHVLFWPSL